MITPLRINSAYVLFEQNLVMIASKIKRNYFPAHNEALCTEDAVNITASVILHIFLSSALNGNQRTDLCFIRFVPATEHIRNSKKKTGLTLQLFRLCKTSIISVPGKNKNPVLCSRLAK
jgi:hypothetical protein